MVIRCVRASTLLHLASKQTSWLEFLLSFLTAEVAWRSFMTGLDQDRHQICQLVLTSDGSASRLCGGCRRTADRMIERRMVTGPGACTVKSFFSWFLLKSLLSDWRLYCSLIVRAWPCLHFLRIIILCSKLSERLIHPGILWIWQCMPCVGNDGNGLG